MLVSLRKLFVRKAAPAMPTRRDLVEDLEAAAAERGLPVPDVSTMKTRKAIADATEAIRAADSADLAADADAPEPTAAQLNGEGPKVVRNEGEVYQAAYADARASGASHLAAHEDALYAVRSFTAGNLALHPLPPKPAIAKPASITVQAGYRPIESAKPSVQTAAIAKPAASQTPTDKAQAATSNPKATMPASYSTPGDSKSATITFKDAQGNTHHHKRYWSEEERLAFEPPIPKPYPTAIWGSVKWAEELFAFFDGLTAQAKQRLHHKFPDWNADAQLAESILAAEKRRLEVVANAKGRKYNPVP